MKVHKDKKSARRKYGLILSEKPQIFGIADLQETRSPGFVTMKVTGKCSASFHLADDQEAAGG
jgi:hypothetical protein